MLKKIHDFAGVMQMGAVFGVPLLAGMYILWGIIRIIIRLIDKEVN